VQLAFAFACWGTYDKIKSKYENSQKWRISMAVKIKTKYGLIDISNNVIATVVGASATANYGIVGMASKNALRDGVYDILNRENYKRGVVVRSKENEIVVDVYIIVGYGLKISEVSRNVQSSVKYNLQQHLGIHTKAVNVIVHGVKILDE
jgi:uncharacterized alkaline shock family protein YloU